MAVPELRLTRDQWATIVRHLRACLPEEGCGLLGGREARVELVVPIENVEHSPVRYTLEPRAFVAALGRLESLGLGLLAAFHSHPVGPLGVSQDDVREWQYPEAVLMVCVPGEPEWQARGFVVAGGRVTDAPLHIGGD